MRIDNEIDKVMDWMDDCLLAGEFHIVDNALARTDPSTVSIEVSLAMLTLAIAARDKLRYYDEFVSKVRDYLVELRGEDEAMALISGLE